MSEARTTQSLRLARAGFYQIHFANGRDAVIGVNPDRRESDLQAMAPDLLRALEWKLRAAAAQAAGSAPDESKFRIVSLWWYVMLLGIDRRSGGDGARQRIYGHAAGGSMSHSSELNSYISQLRKRLRLGAWLRGAAIFTGTALAVTLALVLMLNLLAFPARGVTVARLLILAALAAAAIFGHGFAADAPYSRARRSPGRSRESRDRTAADYF